MTLKIGQPFEFMLVSESGTDDKKFQDVLKKHKGKTVAETKYDGYRIQVHKNSGLWLFTKNLNPLNSGLFPELNRNFRKLPDGIYDGELVGYGKSSDEFNAVKRRIRGELDPELAKQYPIQIRYFDVIMLGNKELVNKPLYERRKTLENYVGNISEQNEFLNTEDLKRQFERVTEKGAEGLVCKNPDSVYQFGARNSDWIKLKNFLTLDLVVLGLYKGEGKASKLRFAALLLGTKNNGRYETITKVGISNRELIDNLYDRIKGGIVSNVPGNVVISGELNKASYAGKRPYCYVTPEKSAVVEIKALNVTKAKNWYTCGRDANGAYSLRIPVVERIRNDKRITDCTTTDQIAEIYNG